MGALAPRAAIPMVPCGPDSCPMTATPTGLESCSRMLVTATVRANAGTARQSEPDSTSLEFCLPIRVMPSFSAEVV